jgi:hypothetical protein
LNSCGIAAALRFWSGGFLVAVSGRAVTCGAGDLNEVT